MDRGALTGLHHRNEGRAESVSTRAELFAISILSTPHSRISGPALLPDNRIINRVNEKRMEESLETDESQDRVFFFEGV